MKTQRRAAGLVLSAVVMLSGCSLGQALGAGGASPSPGNPGVDASGSPVPLPDYNSRYGNNRIGALASIRVGRALYAKKQFWEVYIRTDPAVLDGAYEPEHPESFDPLARQVNQADLILATESAESIKLLAAGGVGHEKADLTDLAKVVAAAFPSARVVKIQVYFGEGNLHSTATYQDGTLDYTPGPAR